VVSIDRALPADNTEQPQRDPVRMEIQMNPPKSLVVALLAAGGMTSALAQEATPDTWLRSQSTLSRAAVSAEAAAALRAGEIEFGEATRVARLPNDRTHAVARMRSDVRAEALQALHSGQLGYGEVTVFR
jgi:hypothetical protein